MTETGAVVAVFGRRYEVETDAGARLDCVTRGKKRDAACGDRVEIKSTGPGQAVIETILPRRNFLERADPYKRKAIAANADQLLVLVAADPWFSDEFVTRVLLLAHDAGIDAFIGLNKVDLAGASAARARLQPFENAGYAVLEVAVRPRNAAGEKVETAIGTDVLRQRLAGRATVLVGQSGMGKSSLVNALIPDAEAVTGELSQALGSGRHTTTFSRRYRIDGESTLIDCPGMQEGGGFNLDFARLEAGFPDFAPFRGQCRFADCRHDREPGCAFAGAATSGRIDARRFELFCRLRGEVGPATR